MASLVTTALTVGTTSTVHAKELRVALSTMIKNVDPQDNTGNNGAPLIYQAFETLIERDPFANPLKFKPGLATSWNKVSPTVWGSTSAKTSKCMMVPSWTPMTSHSR